LVVAIPFTKKVTTHFSGPLVCRIRQVPLLFIFSIIVLSCRLKWCMTNSNIQSTIIYSIQLNIVNMSSSPIEYTSFTKILLCCNIPALSASSLQKKRRNKVMCEIQNINEKTMKGRRVFSWNLCILLVKNSCWHKLVYSIGEELMLTWTVVFYWWRTHVDINCGILLVKNSCWHELWYSTPIEYHSLCQHEFFTNRIPQFMSTWVLHQ
jgi:hypothetical protein